MTERRIMQAAALLAFNTLLATCPATASETDLARQITQQDGWVSYQVPMVAAAGAPCCLEISAGHAKAGCDLDGRSWNVGRNDDEPVRADGTLALYLHVHDAKVDKVRAFAASCPVRDADHVRHVEAVGSTDSVAWLAHTLARDEKFGDSADTELAALAMHDDATATDALKQLTDVSHPRKLREQALFWSGQMRGAEGARLVERFATTDADPQLRAHAVFVLSQAGGMDGYASIYRIALNDASEHVREQALFWMAQTGDKRAQHDIVAALDKEPSDKVREQAVFALSQLKDHEADAALIALVRGHYPRKVKQQALFWLGQSGSNEALEFIDEVLSRRATSSSGS